MNEQRWYVVEKTNFAGSETTVAYKGENKAEAIRYARELAAMTGNEGALIVVNDNLGEEMWNNEGVGN